MERQMSSDYEYIVKHGKVHIKRYHGSDARVYVPSMIDGKPVTKICMWAFWRHNEITEVVVPDTVKFIDYGAFGLCENLRKVTFTSKVFLRGAVFINSGLEEIEGIEYVTGDVSNRKFFEDTPFYNKTETFIADGKLVWCNTRSKVYEVPSGVKEIGCFAFAGSAVEKVILPEGLLTLQNWAFSNSMISSFNIPDSVVNVGTCALRSKAVICPENISIPSDFAMREGWRDCEVVSGVKVIHDTQIVQYLKKPEPSEFVYEDVSVNACSFEPFGVQYDRQIFPASMKFLKHVRLIGQARVSVFKTDDFVCEEEDVFGQGSWYLFPWRNSPRRLRIIFNIGGRESQVLFYFPSLPWEREDSPLTDFYNRCLKNGKDGKFLDFDVYDGGILEQDLPFRILIEMAYLRLTSNYRLSGEARGAYVEYFRFHHRKCERFMKICENEDIRNFLKDVLSND